MKNNMKFHQEKIQGMTNAGLKFFINLTANDAEFPKEITKIAVEELESRLSKTQFVSVCYELKLNASQTV